MFVFAVFSLNYILTSKYLYKTYDGRLSVHVCVRVAKTPKSLFVCEYVYMYVCVMFFFVFIFEFRLNFVGCVLLYFHMTIWNMFRGLDICVSVCALYFYSEFGVL